MKVCGWVGENVWTSGCMCVNEWVKLCRRVGESVAEWVKMYEPVGESVWMSG